MTLPVFKAVGATWALMLEHPVSILKVIWLPLAVLMGASFWLTPQSLEAAAAGAEGAQTVLVNQLLMMALTVAAAVIITTGLLKLVIRGETSSLPAYLSFGRDEANVLGTVLAMTAVFIGCGLAAFIIGAFSRVVFSALAGMGAVLGAVTELAVTGVIAWLGLRLSLASPAAVDLQRIGLGSSWATTKGKSWQLLGFWLLIGVPSVILFLIYIAMLLPTLPPMPTTPDREAIERWQQTVNLAQAAGLRDGSGLPMFIVSQLATAVATMVMPIAGGVAWRMLTGDRSTAETIAEPVG